MSRNWYVVQTFTGQENKAFEYLHKKLAEDAFKDRIFDVMVPEEQRFEMKNGRKRSIRSKMFPGYILVEMEFSDETYRIIRDTPGVTNFVGYDGESPPRPLGKNELKNLIVKEKEEVVAEEPQAPVKLFRVDERVKIIDGAFKDFVGVVEDVNDEKGRLKVRVEIFGRSTPVDVDFLQVERIS